MKKLYTLISLLFIILNAGCYDFIVEDKINHKTLIDNNRLNSRDWLIVRAGNKTLFPSKLNDIKILNNSYIVTIDQQNLLLSEDGGFHWERINMPQILNTNKKKISINWKAVVILKEDNFIVLGYEKTGTNRTIHIYKTINSGKSWHKLLRSSLSLNERESLANNLNLIFNDRDWDEKNFKTNVAFADRFIEEHCNNFNLERIGYKTIIATAGYRNSFITHNNGESWTRVEWGREFNPISINTINSLTPSSPSSIYIAGISNKNSLLLSSFDAGENWFEITVPNDIKVSYVKFIDHKRLGFIAGDKGKIYITYDEGKNWLDRSINSNIHISSLFFTERGKGWAFADKINDLNSGAIYYTEDFGKNWELQLNAEYRINKYAGLIFGKIVAAGYKIGTNSNIIAMYDFTPSIEFQKRLTELNHIGKLMTLSYKTKEETNLDNVTPIDLTPEYVIKHNKKMANKVIVTGADGNVIMDKSIELPEKEQGVYSYYYTDEEDCNKLPKKTSWEKVKDFFSLLFGIDDTPPLFLE